MSSKDTEKRTDQKEVHPEVLRQIVAAVTSLRFGSVEIIVHEGRVVQIERKEKMRLERDHLS